MTLFQYPKDFHRRRLSPRKFKRYRSYKRYLQREFDRVCVYCRQPDTSAPNLNFGADHYRPKSLRKFAHLVVAYSNLYYCCGSCNSRKGNDWPVDEGKGPFVVNPCDFQMTKHLRFDAATGRVQPHGLHGEHTEELLQLNDPASLDYRLNALRQVRLCDREATALQADLDELKKRHRRGELPSADYDAERASVLRDREVVQRLRDSITGLTPLPPLPTHRRNVRLAT